MSPQSALCQIRWASWSMLVILFKEGGLFLGLLPALEAPWRTETDADEGHQSAWPPPPQLLHNKARLFFNNKGNNSVFLIDLTS